MMSRLWCPPGQRLRDTTQVQSFDERPYLLPYLGEYRDMLGVGGTKTYTWLHQ